MARPPFRKRRTDTSASHEVLFGLNPVLEVLRASPHLVERLLVVPALQGGERVTSEARRHGIAVEVVDRAALDQATGGGHHQGVAARTKPFAFADLEDVVAAGPRLLVVLDGITDPQNLGAIVRSAEVLGAGGLVVPKDRSVGVTSTVIRASSGAAIHLPIAQTVNLVRALEILKERGYWIVALAADGTSKFQDLPSIERAAVVVGGEGKGIRPLVARSCDFTVAIPVRGRVASLNAAAAAAIGIHEMASRLAIRAAEPGVC
jgi:23S rRNA (guanosine2251-2'-O)-methyltransferase